MFKLSLWRLRCGKQCPLLRSRPRREHPDSFPASQRVQLPGGLPFRFQRDIFGIIIFCLCMYFLLFLILPWGKECSLLIHCCSSILFYYFIFLFFHLCVYLRTYLRVYLFMCLFTCLLIYVFIYICMYVCILYLFLSLFLHIFCYFWCSSILSVPSAAERFVSIEKEISTRKSCVVLSPHNIRNNEIMK